jgi:hypothetical protein
LFFGGMISLSDNHGGCQCCSRPKPSNIGCHTSKIKYERLQEQSTSENKWTISLILFLSLHLPPRGLFIHARRLLMGPKCPCNHYISRGYSLPSWGLFAIRNPRLPHIALAQRDPTNSAPCHLLDRLDGLLAVRCCRPCEGDWLIP